MGVILDYRRSGLGVLDVDEDDASGPGWITLSHKATRKQS